MHPTEYEIEPRGNLNKNFESENYTLPGYLQPILMLFGYWHPSCLRIRYMNNSVDIIRKLTRLSQSETGRFKLTIFTSCIWRRTQYARSPTGYSSDKMFSPKQNCNPRHSTAKPGKKCSNILRQELNLLWWPVLSPHTVGTLKKLPDTVIKSKTHCPFRLGCAS